MKRALIFIAALLLLAAPARAAPAEGDYGAGAVENAVPDSARTVIVQYVMDEATAKQLQHRLEGRLGKPVLLRPIGPVLAIHLGTDIVGVAWQG